MALPSSGQISISSSISAASTQISFETTQSGKAINYSLIRLSRGDFNSNSDILSGYAGINQNSTNKPDRAAQHSMSEFLSYNHTQNGSCSGTSFGDAISTSTVNLDNRRSYHRILVSGNVGDIVTITVVCPDRYGPEPFGPFSYGYYYIYNTYPFDTYGSLITGTALFSGFTSDSTNTHHYVLVSTSDILHIVSYLELPALL